MYDDVVCAEGLSSLGIANQMSPYVTCRGVLWRAVGRSGGGGSSCVCYQRAGLDAVWERDGKEEEEEEDKTILYDAGRNSGDEEKNCQRKVGKNTQQDVLQAASSFFYFYFSSKESSRFLSGEFIFFHQCFLLKQQTGILSRGP